MQMSFTRGRATTSPRTSRPAVASRGARLHPLPRATVLVLVLIAHSAAAQPAPATPPLAPDHWVHDALDRLASAGLLDGDWLAGARPASEHALAAAARVAAARADGSPLEPFAHAVAERLAEESSPSAGDAACSPAAAHRSFRAGLGALHAVGGIADASAMVLDGRASVGLGCRVALLYEGEARVGEAGGALRSERFGVVGRIGPVLAYVGRVDLRFGLGATGGIILGDAVPFDGVALTLDRPVRLRGFLRRLGPVHAVLLVSRLGGDTLGPTAGFTAVRLAVSPHPRVQLGVNRSILFQTARDGRRLGPKELAYIAIGKHTVFDDQRVSFEAQLRMAAAGWSVLAFIEWGLEDSAGMDEDPALRVGLSLPVVPALPGLALRYEYTAFGRDTRAVCPFCGGGDVRSWYRHSTPPRFAYADGDGTPFGHALGGYGHEHRVETHAWLDDARLRLRAAFTASEREPGNLLYERKPGAGWGAALEAAYRVGRRFEVAAAAAVERGRAGWSEHRTRVGVSGFF